MFIYLVTAGSFRIYTW